jgi:hypothetical protein
VALGVSVECILTAKGLFSISLAVTAAETRHTAVWACWYVGEVVHHVNELALRVDGLFAIMIIFFVAPTGPLW